MKRYAVLGIDGAVDNIIVANSLDIAEQITSSQCVFIPAGSIVNIGDSYVDGTFISSLEG